MRGRNLGRDIPVDSAPVVRLMPGKFTLAGHPFFAHWTQEPMPQKSNILEGCHSIPRRTTSVWFHANINLAKPIATAGSHCVG